MFISIDIIIPVIIFVIIFGDYRFCSHFVLKVFGCGVIIFVTAFVRFFLFSFLSLFYKNVIHSYYNNVF
jgi:type IV secretory pathway TrbL component